MAIEDGVPLLGAPDAGLINYILYAPCVSMFLGPCAQCQVAIGRRVI